MAIGASAVGGGLGSILGGPVGGVLGTLGGSLLSGVLGSKAGKRGRVQRHELLTPEQQQAQNFALQRGQNLLANPGQGFEPIAQQAMDRFQNQVVPSIAERFTAMGNGQRSSGFQSALQQGGVGLSRDLAAQQAGYGLQQQQLGANLLGQGQRPAFEYSYQQPQGGFLGNALGGLSSGLGALGIQGLGQNLGFFGPQGQDQSGISGLLSALQNVRGQNPMIPAGEGASQTLARETGQASPAQQQPYGYPSASFGGMPSQFAQSRLQSALGTPQQGGYGQFAQSQLMNRFSNPYAQLAGY